MLEFENLVYLDLQKTGSNFVKKFLRRFSATPVVASSNGLPREERKEGALHVISVRHPLPHYLSLYSYGCEGKGGLRNRMNGDGYDDLYCASQAGFEQWLRLLLDPDSPYAGNTQFGFQTARLLKLAFPGFRKALQNVEAPDEIRAVVQRSASMDFVLKQESLNDDLMRLATEHPALFKYREAIPAYLSKAKKANPSRKLDIDLARIPDDLRTRLVAREWLLLDLLGYG